MQVVLYSGRKTVVVVVGRGGAGVGGRGGRGSGGGLCYSIIQFTGACLILLY